MTSATGRHYNVLFLCTGNSARSIMAEAIMNRKGRDHFTAYSAGSQPAGAVRPEALARIENAGLSADGYRSKSWEEFAGPDAPPLDFVFTVCDRAAQETCPLWPGQPMTAHWGIPDPAAAQGSPGVIDRAFTQAFSMLERRISLFLSLPLATLDSFALQRELDAIGRPATPATPQPLSGDPHMLRVIFACVHNAGRSQMAAAFFNQLADPQKAAAVSAGTDPGTRVHPEVLSVMQEIGIDLSAAKPQKLTDELAQQAQLLITMGCGDQCPVVPGLRRGDWPLTDPKGRPVEEVRAIRDEIKGRVQALIAAENVAP